jgi:hypothetical protein
LAQRVQGVRVLDKPPSGMVVIHKEGKVEWLVPAEAASELTPTVAAGRPFVGTPQGGASAGPTGAQLPTTATPTIATQVAAATELRGKAAQALGTIVPATSQPPLLPITIAKLEALAATHPEAAGDIAWVIKHTDIVWEALQKPQAYAFAVGELELAQRMLVSSSETDLVKRYVEAMIQLARQRDYDVIDMTYDPASGGTVTLTSTRGGPSLTLSAPGGALSDEDFMNELIGSGQMFIDRAALEFTEEGLHGAPTHFLDDLVVDRALQPYGSTSVEFRNRLKAINSLPGGPGTDIWTSTYDTFQGVGSPENLWPPLRDLLGIEKKKL